MKKKIFKLVIILAATFAASCDDFLDRQPQSLAVDEKFWQTETEANSGVAGGYSLLREALNNVMVYWAYGDAPTDEFQFCEYDFNPIRLYDLSMSIPSAEFWRPMKRARDWTQFYRVIDQSNRIISKVQGIADNKFSSFDKDHLVGEGYFLRAYTYFYMSRVWGGVPLITEPYDDPLTASFFVERATEEEIHAQIEADIAKAIELLTSEKLGREGSRANKAVAYALQAHFLAWKGDYAGVVSALDNFEQEGTDYGYGPREEGYLDRYYKGNTVDNVFFIPKLKEDNESSYRWGGAADSEIGAQTGLWLNSSSNDERYHVDPRTVPQWQIDKTRLLDLFSDTDDYRFQNGFKYTDVDDEFPMIMKYTNFEVGAEPWVGRYSYVINIFRYTDLRLLKAEALAATGQGGEDILNEVRAANNLDVWDGIGTLYEAVMEERARELFLEGHRFYDMVRMAKHKGIFKFENMSPTEFSQGKYYWPVDPTLFVNNSALKQTEFWGSSL